MQQSTAVVPSTSKCVKIYSHYKFLFIKHLCGHSAVMINFCLALSSTFLLGKDGFKGLCNNMTLPGASQSMFSISSRKLSNFYLSLGLDQYSSLPIHLADADTDTSICSPLLMQTICCGRWVFAKHNIEKQIMG